MPQSGAGTVGEGVRAARSAGRATASLGLVESSVAAAGGLCRRALLSLGSAPLARRG